jgi:hypothetical protein
MAANLEELTQIQLIKALILFKPGGGNFLDEELTKVIKNASEELPRLEAVTKKTLDVLFWFDSCYLHGEWDLPHYRLSDEGREVYKKWIRDNYGNEVLELLKPIAEKAWNS